MGEQEAVVTEEQERLLREEMIRVAVFRQTCLDPKSRGNDAHDQLMLDLFRARSIWDSHDGAQQRLSIVAYIDAFRNWVRRLSPNDCGDLCLPLVELAGAIKDLNFGVTASWLRADHVGGTRRDPRTTAWRRAVLAAGVEQYMRAGLSIEHGCQEIGQATGVKPSKIKEQRKRIVRGGDKGASRDECADFDRLSVFFADVPPAAIPGLIEFALRARPRTLLD